jgi:2-C-methyl-D-erythritol 4-phosphate cytidylyltransferase
MNAVIIVAAGKGTRMGPNVDKLFLSLGGSPVIAHTWRRFDQLPEFAEIILVVREGMREAFQDLGKEQGFRKPVRFAIGGRGRQDSVWNGLEALDPGTEIVAIQDGARPCTPVSVILDSISEARAHGAAVAAQPIVDTIKESEDGRTVARTLDRSRLWAVQTPQTFQVGVIRHALKEVRRRGLVVTDDTAACELTGHPVRLVSCTQPNPKVTRPDDLPYLEYLLGTGVTK